MTTNLYLNWPLDIMSRESLLQHGIFAKKLIYFQHQSTLFFPLQILSMATSYTVASQKFIQCHLLSPEANSPMNLYRLRHHAAVQPLTTCLLRFWEMQGMWLQLLLFSEDSSACHPLPVMVAVVAKQKILTTLVPYAH